MVIRLILFGLLYVCVLASSEECNRELQKNTDFPGADVATFYSPNVAHCQQLCTEHHSCNFFTFVRPDWTKDDRHFYCYLKSTPSGKPKVQVPLTGVTSGFSLKPCSPNLRPTDYLLQVYQNVDFPGADYRMLFTADYEACRRVCTYDPACQFFTFLNEVFQPANIRHKCHLKFSWAVQTNPIVEVKAGVVSGFSLNQSHDFNTECQMKLWPSTDIPGNDIETLKAASAEHCLTLCSDEPRCTYFSYVSKDFNCYMKNNPNEMVTTFKAGVTSGIPAHFCHIDDAWLKVVHEGVDFRSSDIRFVLVADPEACQKTCTEDPNCQFYTYVRNNFTDPAFRHRCYLKRVITMPAPPKVSKLANAVSGFSLRTSASQMMN